MSLAEEGHEEVKVHQPLWQTTQTTVILWVSFFSSIEWHVITFRTHRLLVVVLQVIHPAEEAKGGARGFTRVAVGGDG